MSGKAQRPPAGEPWVWLTKELIKSDAWRSLGINERRVIDFLMLEHMAHAGKQNGRLKAPHQHLETFGIGAKYIASAIAEVERLGLIECRRGGMRVATTFALAWLPLHDGAVLSERWREFRNHALSPISTPKNKNLPVKGEAALPFKGEADGKNLPVKGEADGPKICPSKVRSF